MHADFWHEKWADNQIGFHQEQVNKRLIEFWPTLELDPASCVFVPLCGKSIDMLWLHEQGHRVLGIELSEKAVRDFFADNGLEARRIDDGDFDRWQGQGRAEGIDLLVGDFFALTAERLKSANVAALYDRASLIAMNDELRPRYAETFRQVVPAASTGLVIAIDYDPLEMKGPPFPVPDSLVHALLDEDFDIETLAHYSGPGQRGNLADRGLTTIDERVYRVTRRA